MLQVRIANELIVAAYNTAAYGGTVVKYSHSTSMGPPLRASHKPGQVVGFVLIAVLF
jgi:hypothetical protein